jgi:hypothetical protein
MRCAPPLPFCSTGGSGAALHCFTLARRAVSDVVGAGHPLVVAATLGSAHVCHRKHRPAAARRLALTAGAAGAGAAGAGTAGAGPPPGVPHAAAPAAAWVAGLAARDLGRAGEAAGTARALGAAVAGLDAVGLPHPGVSADAVAALLAAALRLAHDPVVLGTGVCAGRGRG